MKNQEETICTGALYCLQKVLIIKFVVVDLELYGSDSGLIINGKSKEETLREGDALLSTHHPPEQIATGEEDFNPLTVVDGSLQVIY